MGMGDKMDFFPLNKSLKLEFFGGQVFGYESLRLPKKLDPWRTPLAQSVVMLTNMSSFHPCLKFSTREVLAIV